jgi:hypothetical protein
MTRNNSIAKRYLSTDASPTINPLDAIAKQLHLLTPTELEEIQDMIAALLDVHRLGEEDEPEPERPTSESTNRQGRGHIEIKLIPDNVRNKHYGPYKYLRYWNQGRLRTRYLGKA